MHVGMKIRILLCAIYSPPYLLNKILELHQSSNVESWGLRFFVNHSLCFKKDFL